MVPPAPWGCLCWQVPSPPPCTPGKLPNPEGQEHLLSRAPGDPDDIPGLSNFRVRLIYSLLFPRVAPGRLAGPSPRAEPGPCPMDGSRWQVHRGVSDTTRCGAPHPCEACACFPGGDEACAPRRQQSLGLEAEGGHAGALGDAQRWGLRVRLEEAGRKTKRRPTDSWEVEGRPGSPPGRALGVADISF